MFIPQDPRFDEILELASHATGGGLLDQLRPRWRELVTQLLGSIQEASGGKIPERRQNLRAAIELAVDIVAPEELASLATSTVGSGGLSIRIAEVLPVGTRLDLSLELQDRPVPLLAKGQVAWSRPGEVGVAFIDLFQNDREHLEGLAVKALLAQAAVE